MTIKTGDRVRCTLGESVIVGTVHYVYSGSWDVLADGAVVMSVITSPPWQFEVIPPKIPNDIGTLVMAERAGSVYVRTESGWVWTWRVNAGMQSDGRTLDQLREDYGPMIHIAIVKP